VRSIGNKRLVLIIMVGINSATDGNMVVGFGVDLD
jgi:hypothetical protein